MPIQIINTGTSPNAGNGDNLRAAFNKINSNFLSIQSSLTNFISSGTIGPAGPQGPPGPQGDPGIGSISVGRTGNFVYISSTLTQQLTGVDALNFNPINNTIVIGNEFNTTTNFTYYRQTYSSTLGSGVTFAEHHETPDVTNFVFLRTRGTNLNKTPLMANDDIADIGFLTINTANSFTGVVNLTVSVVNTSTLYPVGVLKYFINDGLSQTPKEIANLTSSGTWKVNYLDSFTTGTSLRVSNNLLPSQNLTYDLGSTSSQWRSLYVGNNLVFSDGTTQTTAYNFINTIPASSTSTGITGQIAVDSTSMYVCIATNSWLRFNGVTF